MRANHISDFKLLKSDKLKVGILIVASLIMGSLYVFIIPPWEHYDEPGRFEYAWLIANRGRLPYPGEFDQVMRRELASSMIEHGFFENRGDEPNLISPGEPVWIGISQLNDPPVYYLIVGSLLRLVRFSDITFQLYLGRLTSLILYSISIVAAFGIAAELSPPGHWLRIVLPGTLILLPGYVDIMTSVNNDVGAVVFFSLFLWICIRILRHGFSWFKLLLGVILAILCFLTKETVAIAIPILLITLMISIRDTYFRNLGYIGLGVAILALLVFSFSWKSVAVWYLQSKPETTSRLSNVNSIHGRNVLKLIPPDSGLLRSRVAQLIPQSNVRTLQGETVTLGAWIWSDESVDLRTPILDDGFNVYAEEIMVDVTPEFYMYTFQVSEDTISIRVLLESAPRQEGKQNGVYYDGVVLVKGDFSQEGYPSFIDPVGDKGIWGDRLFENLIRNSSMERAWFKFTPQVESFLSDLLPYDPSRALSSLSDIPGAEWYYQATFENLLRTFWAKFGWGQVTLTGSRPYRILGLITLLGIAGSILFIWQHWWRLPWKILIVMGISMLLIWYSAVIRGIDSLYLNIFIPGARYAYPAIIPTVLFVCAGWYFLLDKLVKMMGLPSATKNIIYIAGLMILNIVSIHSITQYFHT